MLMYKLTTEDDESTYTDLFTDLALFNIEHYIGKEGIIDIKVYLVNIKREELEEYDFVHKFNCYTKIKDK